MRKNLEKRWSSSKQTGEKRALFFFMYKSTKTILLTSVYKEIAKKTKIVYKEKVQNQITQILMRKKKKKHKKKIFLYFLCSRKKIHRFLVHTKISFDWKYDKRPKEAKIWDKINLNAS